jgi:hypothetical protein
VRESTRSASLVVCVCVCVRVCACVHVCVGGSGGGARERRASYLCCCPSVVNKVWQQPRLIPGAARRRVHLVQLPPPANVGTILDEINWDVLQVCGLIVHMLGVVSVECPSRCIVERAFKALSVPSVFGRSLQCQPVKGANTCTREEGHWSHAWQRFKQSKGVNPNSTHLV